MFGTELAAVFAVVSSTLAVLAHMGRTDWLKIFLYDADSLTLPLLQQSLDRHEAVKWVFSSQLNLFPEGPIYAFSSLFSGSVNITMIINAIVNMLLLYFLLRGLMRALSDAPRSRRLLYSLLVILLIANLMLLEIPTLSLVGQDYISYFLFSTYYGGTLLVGLLATIGLVYQLKSAFSFRERRSQLMLAIVVLTSVLSIASNPLFVLQFSAPFIAALIMLMLFKQLGRRKGLVLITVQFLIVALGYVARLPLVNFIGQSLTSHLSPFELNNWKVAFFYLLDLVVPGDAGAGTRLRSLLTVLLYFTCLLSTLLIMNRKLKYNRDTLRPNQLFVLLTICICPAVLVFVLSSVNSVQERYFIVPLMLPAIALLVLASTKFEARMRRPAIVLAALMSLMILIVGCASLSGLHRLGSATYPGEQCLYASLGSQAANGVGEYSLSRPLDVYSPHGIRVLQVHGQLTVFPWLNNLATYEHKQFTFITALKDDSYSLVNRRPPVALAPASLGEASHVFDCGNFVIYYFAPNTAGNRNLNRKIDTSLQDALAARRAGTVANYNGVSGKLQ